MMDMIAICISLASLFVAIWAVKVSKNIAKQQHDDAVKAEKRQKEKCKREIKNRKEAR